LPNIDSVYTMLVWHHKCRRSQDIIIQILLY